MFFVFLSLYEQLALPDLHFKCLCISGILFISGICINIIHVDLQAGSLYSKTIGLFLQNYLEEEWEGLEKKMSPMHRYI